MQQDDSSQAIKKQAGQAGLPSQCREACFVSRPVVHNHKHNQLQVINHIFTPSALLSVFVRANLQRLKLRK